MVRNDGDMNDQCDCVATLILSKITDTESVSVFERAVASAARSASDSVAVGRGTFHSPECVYEGCDFLTGVCQWYWATV